MNSEQDAGVLLFLSTLNESGFRGENAARVNDEQPDDFVKIFIEDTQFKADTGIDETQLAREVSAIDSRFTDFLEKSRAKIAGGAKEDRTRRSPYLFAKRISDAPLAKSEVASRMYSLLDKLRADCVGDEETQLERAARCLDIPGFCELSERIVGRLKARAA
jgi:hypothetical protein